MSKFSDGWEIQPVCKVCIFRRGFHGKYEATENSRWENTYCSYLETTGECRGCEPIGNDCEKFKPRV